MALFLCKVSRELAPDDGARDDDNGDRDRVMKREENENENNVDCQNGGKNKSDRLLFVITNMCAYISLNGQSHS